MNRKTACRSGFTLIELLIVIAIILILIAIALPNFMEAQMRSKLTRVIADMRTLGIAIESYMTVHRTYPQPSAWGHQSQDPFRYHAFRALSTPIAFLQTGILIDPFAVSGATSSGFDPFKFTYEMGFGSPGHVTGDLDNLLRSTGQMTDRDMFLTHSFGPDNNDDTSIGGFGRVDSTGRPTSTARVYNPTNGAWSDGDVYRVQAPAAFMNYYTGAGSG